jgi:hypothetical protein
MRGRTRFWVVCVRAGACSAGNALVPLALTWLRGFGSVVVLTELGASTLRRVGASPPPAGAVYTLTTGDAASASSYVPLPVPAGVAGAAAAVLTHVCGWSLSRAEA